MRVFNTLVDSFDVLFRVYMKLHAYVRPMRDGRTFFGAEMRCDIRDFIQRRIYFFGIWEPNLTYFFIDTVQPGDVVVDVGANIGYFSILASQLAGPAGKVISIEAAPETFGVLRENIERNACRNVQPLNVAATLDETTVEIVRKDASNCGANAIQVNGELGADRVHGRPVSAILGPSISNVHFVKIDIEGSEAAVLADILKNIGKFPQRLSIASEISERSGKYIELFRQAGFRVARVPNNYAIAYFLVRSYLDRSEENAYSALIPVSGYSPKYSDYVFVRS